MNNDAGIYVFVPIAVFCTNRAYINRAHTNTNRLRARKFWEIFLNAGPYPSKKPYSGAFCLVFLVFQPAYSALQITLQFRNESYFLSVGFGSSSLGFTCGPGRWSGSSSRHGARQGWR